MMAIYKKELKSYFTSMIGFVFMGFLLAIMGIYTTVYNLVNAYSNFEYVLNSLSFILIILIPILTMRVIAEEKKQKTEQLLYTVPVSVEKIIIGKYLAVLTLFLLPMAIILFYPLILHQFGTVNYATAYGGILGFTFMGAAYIALGVFISSLTESQVIAAVISFLVFLLTDLMPAISSILPADNITCLVVLYAVVLIVAWLLYFMMHSYRISIAAAIAGAGAITAAYFIRPSLFDGLLSKLCNGVSVMSRFDNFVLGILDIPAICYYLSIIVLFLFLTITRIKQSFTPKRLKSGAYHSGIIAAVIAIVVVVNLMAAQTKIQLDLSSNSLYTLTGETKKLVEELNDKITIYYVTTEDQKTAEIEKIVKQYDGLSGKIKVVEKDPVLYPKFTKQYTNEEVEAESVIVVNESTGISKYVPYASLLVSEFDYTTYRETVTAVDVEGQITSAIQYVTTNDLPKMYAVSGHGEAAIGDTMQTAIKKLNVDVEDLTTLTAKEIPQDCSILLVNGPTSDLTAQEAAMIKAYLENGGKAILNTAYTDNSMERYDALLAAYGVTRVEGVVLEGTGNYAGNSPAYVVPQTVSHTITDSIGKYLITEVCQGLEVAADLRDTLTVDTLLTTSDDAYSKVDVASETIAREEKDITGPFVLGAAITESKDGKETKIVTVSTGYLLDEALVSTNQFGNSELFLNAVSWLNDTESGLSIPERSISQSYLTVNASQAIFWGMVFVIVIPLALLAAGFVIWLRRRKN